MAISHVFNMDCMEGMKKYPDGFFDLAVVDPPYGINITGRHRSQSVQAERERERGGHRSSAELPDRSAVCGSYGRGRPPISRRAVSGYPSTGKKLKVESKFYPVFDDSSPPDAAYFRELRRVSKNQIIWGGNFFLDNLGATNCLIVWDKKRRGLDQADCEIAWTSFNEQNRIFEFRWNGMLQGDMKNKEERIHPTQKPVALYNWCFQRWCKPGSKILDTHLGSGSSRIAAYENNLDFYGYEIDEFYFKLQEDRFEKHRSQMSLFVNEGD